MSKFVGRKEVRDISEHTVGIEVPDCQETNTLQLMNDLDAKLTVDIYGTHDNDDTYDDAVQIRSQTLSAGEYGYAVIDEPWPRLQLRITANSTPTQNKFRSRLNK